MQEWNKKTSKMNLPRIKLNTRSRGSNHKGSQRIPKALCYINLHRKTIQTGWGRFQTSLRNTWDVFKLSGPGIVRDCTICLDFESEPGACKS